MFQLDLSPWILSSSIVAVATVLLLAVDLLQRSRLRSGNNNLPPGPRPWPVIGNLNLLGPLTHHSLHKLSTQYGPLMSVWIGSVPIVVGSSADAARLLLKTNDQAFIDRPKTTIGRHLANNYCDMFWAPYGKYWQQARKIWHTELLGARQLKAQEHVRLEEIRALLRDLHTSSQSARNRALPLRDHLFMLNLNVISRMVMGKKYVVAEGTAPGSPTTPEEFRWMVDEMFRLIGSLNIGDVIPWVNWLDLQGHVGRTKKLSKMFDRFLEHMLNEHDERRRREGERFVPMDMIDQLLQHADDPNMEVPIKRDGIKAFVLVRIINYIRNYHSTKYPYNFV